MQEQVFEVFVPGRLCVLGEHTDWAAGGRDVNPSIAFGEYRQVMALYYHWYYLYAFTDVCVIPLISSSSAAAAAAGMTVVCATSEGLFASCRACRPGLLRFASTSTAGERRLLELPLSLQELNHEAATNVGCIVWIVMSRLLHRFPLSLLTF
jgi:hypothetical protein